VAAFDVIEKNRAATQENTIIVLIIIPPGWILFASYSTFITYPALPVAFFCKIITHRTWQTPFYAYCAVVCTRASLGFFIAVE
jgi:hypothetical protein